MQSRMDKYSANEPGNRSRTHKNRALYEEVRNSTLTDFDVNSNVTVIETGSNSIDVNELGRMLERRYSDDGSKRRSIDIPSDNFYETEEPLVATKEYDINAILEKAKMGKSTDYTKERLKKVRETQYEILNNLDLELRKVEEARNSEKRKAEEQNLMELINTITQIEIKNKDLPKTATVDLLDLTEENDSVNVDRTLQDVESVIEGELVKTKTIIIPDVPEMKEEKEETPKEEEKKEVVEEVKQEEPKVEETEEQKKDRHINETLSKLDIKMSGYEDFSDISKEDKGTIIIKIVIFLIIIALVFGALYILNDILNLGLFNK